MALVHSFEESGKFLFRYRGQIPVLLFILAIPVVAFTDHSWWSPAVETSVRILAILLSVLGFFIRAYTIGTTPKNTSGRNREKQVADSLNKTGIYSLFRHPLYVGNYFMWIGIVLYTFNIYFVLIVSLAFWLYYERIMFAEERFLERKFGDEYVKWSNRVHAFLPSFSQFTPSDVEFSMKAVLRREYSGVLATVIGFVFVEALRGYFTSGAYYPDEIHLWTLGVALAITIILRTLKRSTRVLSDPSRS